MKRFLARGLASLAHGTQPWRGRAVVVLVVAAVLWGLFAAFPLAWRGFEERGTDVIWRTSAQTEPENRLVVVDIDDASLAQEGPWPWPRATMARLVQQLDHLGAGLKLFDIVFPDASADSHALGLALQAHDATAPAVLAQVFALRGETTLRMGQPVGAIAGGACPSVAAPAQGVVANLPGLHHRAGHITPVVDTDGAVRRVPALVCYQGQAYPALALAGLAAAVDPAAAAPTFRLQPGHELGEPGWYLQGAGLPDQGVGLDAAGHLRVPYRHARSSWVSVSAADVLQGRVPQRLLQGAWVLVGASAFGLSDAVPTALGGAVSGLEVHAQLLTGLLDGHIPYTPKMAPGLQLAYVLAVLAGLLLLCSGNPLHQGRRVLALPLLGAAAAAGAFALHGWALLAQQWYVGWAWPAAFTLLLGSALGLLEHARSLHHKGRLFRNLSSYIPGVVAEQIALQSPSSEIQAQRQDVTVLAADVRNFSAYCEARSPEDAARVLHRFYTTASEIVAAHGGVVEEMVGDSLLAVFNGPQPTPNHPEQALAAARQIWLRCGEELPNTLGQGLEPLAISIGLESGVALVGSFGAVERRVHTVLGTTVTVALRLRDMTADLAYPVLVGQEAAGRIPARLDQPNSVLKPLGSFLLPGLRHSGKIYTLRHLLQPNTALDQQTLDYLNHHNQVA